MPCPLHYPGTNIQPKTPLHHQLLRKHPHHHPDQPAQHSHIALKHGRSARGWQSKLRTGFCIATCTKLPTLPFHEHRTEHRKHGADHHTTVGRLKDVRDNGPHPLFKNGRSIEEWVFEVEVRPGSWELMSFHFPRWNHRHSARAKFLRTWLEADYRPEFLSNPKVLIGRTAELEVRTSIDSDDNMVQSLRSAKPTTKIVDSPGFRTPGQS